MINRYLTAVSDAPLDTGWSLDEDRDLPFEADHCYDPEAAFEVDSEWSEIQADAVSRLWDRLSDEERVELGCTPVRGRTLTIPSMPRLSGSGWRPPCWSGSGASTKTRAPA